MRRGSHRFVTRAQVTILATVAFVLTAVFLVGSISVRRHARASVAEKLETSQRLLVALERQRTRELQTQAATLADNPTLKAALDAHHRELRYASDEVRAQLHATVRRELEAQAARLDADVIAASNPDGHLLGVAGRRRDDWTSADEAEPSPESTERFVTLPSGLFRIVTVTVMLQGEPIGRIQLARALDGRYAMDVASLSGAKTLVAFGDQVAATTLPPAAAGAIDRAWFRSFSTEEPLRLAGDEYIVRPVLREREVALYLLDSVDAAARPLVQWWLRAIAAVAAGAFLVSALAGLWLGRTISRPIGTLSASLHAMSANRTFDQGLAASGTSLEIETLTEALDTMIGSIKASEGEVLNACLESIRALSQALDARDPYTAGHSERVSELSVAIGREMKLDEQTLEVLRLGALLHDIGKVAIGDQILRKPSALTAGEYEVVKTHPTIGCRILRTIRLLDAHLPIVELHHERPDGRGYPYGLVAHQIPMSARIVHVADAYDAMTSARPYRPALPVAAGLAELRRCTGTDFDADVVRALVVVVSAGGGRLAPGELDGFRAETGQASHPATRPVVDPLDAFGSEGQVA